MKSDKELLDIYHDGKQFQLTDEERNRLHTHPTFISESQAVTKSTAKNENPQDKMVYRTRGLWDLAKIDLPEPVYLWNGITMTPGAVIEIIGAPGIGKSRVVADLARHQILGRDFGGRPTHKEPVRWLFAGSENGINRLGYESKAFVLRRKPSEVRDMNEEARISLAKRNGFSREDIKKLNSYFRTFTLENLEDFDISLMSEENIAKLTATLKKECPRVLVVDPWGDVIAGKELDDGDVRNTVHILRNCLANAGLHDSMLIIVNHARMGSKEEAAARGTDEGNFGKNSKCLYSIARYVINIRRASFDDNPDIELINAKNNDGKKAQPMALHLNGKTMSYELVEGFNHDAWQQTLEKAAKECGKRIGKETSPDAMINDAIKIVTNAGVDGILGIEKFKEGMAKAGYNATQLRGFLKARREDRPEEAKLVFQRQVHRVGDHVCIKPKNKHGVEYITTPEIRDAYLQTYGVMNPLDVTC